MGIDFSAAVVAQEVPPSELRSYAGNARSFPPGKKFDVIVLSDSINDLSDVRASLTQVRAKAPRIRQFFAAEQGWAEARNLRKSTKNLA